MKIALYSLFALTFFSTAQAETYHLLNVRDLTFEDGQNKLKESLDYTVSKDTQLPWVSVRFPEQAYIAFVPTGERQWQVAQGELRVAFRLNDGDVQKGFIDLWNRHRDKKLTRFAFTLDPSKARTCTKEEFTSLQQKHYKRLSNNNLPGTAWFRQQAGPAFKHSERLGRWNRRGLDDTFSIFTGGRALSENLALDRNIILGLSVDKDGKEKKKAPYVAIDTIKGVTVKAIDWKGKLPEGKVTVDPLSLAIPIDQHALFAPSLKGLFELMDLVEKEGTPLIQSFTVRNPFRTLPSKYRAQMGLDLPDIVARLLPIKSTAVTGSDPFFPTGTAVAVLFETDQAELLYQTLAKTISIKAFQVNASIIKVDGGNFDHLGFETTDRSFSSHVIRSGNLVVVSNSTGQVKRLVAVQEKKVESLGASEEYRFFRHRYAMNHPDQPASAFVFISDATLRRWAGPEIRIAASRRVRASAALSQLAAEAMAGVPVSKDFEPLLGKVTVKGRQVTSEHYGTLSFITPVSEHPLTTVTAVEKTAYERWRGGYEGGWSKVFDPIAIRLALSDKNRAIDMTILPLRVDSDYREMISMVGQSVLSPKGRAIPAEALLYAALAVDSKSEAFKEFDQQLLEMLPGIKINPLSWVGQSVSVHLEDGFFWTAAARSNNGSMDLFEILPICVRVESKSRLKLALFLAALKGMVDTSAPDLVRWEKRKHGEQSYLAVIGDEMEVGASLSIYYAAMPKALLISLDEEILQRAIDRERVPLTPEQLKNLPQARHLLFESDNRIILNSGSLMGDQPFDEKRMWESWKALPILNEWHQRFPDSDPAKIQLEAFASDIHCPGGKGYRWNAKAMTMESIAYGHPAEPRSDASGISALANYPNLSASMAFQDGGLRVRAKMGEASPRIDGPAVQAGPPVILAKAEDLIATKVGHTMVYTKAGVVEKAEVMQSKILKVEKTDHGIEIEREMTYTDAEGKPLPSTRKELLKDGLYHREVKSTFSLDVFKPSYMQIPAVLIEGKNYKSTYTGTSTNSDGRSQNLLGHLSITVSGGDTIKTPTGVYKNCIRVINRSHHLHGDNFMSQTLTEWYHQGTGIVKFSYTVMGETRTFELTEVK